MEQSIFDYKIGEHRDPRFVKMLVDEYNTTGISLFDLSKKYHTDASYQFKINNIPKRNGYLQRCMSRTGCINFNWNGEKIETEEQAYIAGLLFSDGYVGKQQLGLRLQKSDKDLIEQVKNYFSKDLKMQEDDNSYKFVLSSTLLCENFIKLGMVRDKTKLGVHIPKMDKSLYRHFIRGYFDGDGTIYVCNTKTDYTYLKTYICSATIDILEEFQKVLSDNNIESKINKENRKGRVMKVPHGMSLCTMDMYRLFIRKKTEIEKFYHYLYDDSHIFLERKKSKFKKNLNLLNYVKKHTSMPS